ncbi:hypothetical protein ACHQM5_004826 [Ranunculus cassubicifolius]
MGSEKKSKRRSPSSDSEGERRSKKQTATREDKERSSSSSKREKSSDKRIHKSSKHSDRGKKSEEKHDRKRHKRETHVGHPELSSEDYFSKNKEFATWLKQEKKIFFSDLSSEESRKLFSDFVKKWNKGRLESQYYEGISTAPRTSHNWKIKAK